MADITWTNETRRLRDLKPQADNPREIKKGQAKRLVESWHKFGQPDVISINPDNTILNGHQRFYVWGAAYGMDFEVAVRVASRQFTRAEWQEYTVVSHEGAVGGWDWEGLANWEGVGVAELVEWGFDEATLLGAGFEFDEGGGIPDPGVDLDKADELQQKWGTATGQIWELGEHRLAVGDCTDGVILPRLVQDTVIDLLLTDPPYGVDWDTDYTRFTTEYGGKRIKHPPIVNDDKPFDASPWMHYPQVILWGANWYCQHIPMGTWLVWDKRHTSGAAFLSDAELAWQKGRRGVYIYAETVQGAHRKEKASHPTQKPVGLMGWCIGRYENVGIVLDPYLGSGTTLIAAHQLGRKCYAVEILPAYAAVSIQRWVDLTGLEPVRIESN